MGLRDLFRGTSEDSPENIGKITSDKAVDIIRKLSGNGVNYTKKVIDNVVIVTGAAGGTGASTIVSNIAYMTAKKGLKVLVIDLNIMYPMQHNYFRLKQEIEKPDLVSFLLGNNTLGESLESYENISVFHANNRGLMDYINCESDIAVKNFQDALDKLRQLYDLILIDAPMSIDHTLINTAFYIADQIYLVWDEGITSIANTERIRRNMAMSGIDAYTKMRAILNKRTQVYYNKSVFEQLNIEVAQVLPFSLSIIECGLRSHIFCDKGASASEEANKFYSGILNLSDKILENGGYIK